MFVTAEVVQAARAVAVAAGQAFQSSRLSVSLERVSTSWYSCPFRLRMRFSSANSEDADLESCLRLSRISKAFCFQFPKAGCPI